MPAVYLLTGSAAPMPDTLRDQNVVYGNVRFCHTCDIKYRKRTAAALNNGAYAISPVYLVSSMNPKSMLPSGLVPSVKSVELNQMVKTTSDSWSMIAPRKDGT